MKELEFANELADLADEISMRYFRSDEMSVRSKSDGTPVTQADEEIERALRERIAQAFPEHGVFGEEEGETDGASGDRWIIDPIDGTKNFSWGIPNWATLIAFESGGEVACGVASAPSIGERYAAGRGLGASRNGEPIRVSDRSDLAEARLGFTSAAAFEGTDRAEQYRTLLQTVAHDRGFGDFYGHVLVAAGALDVMVEPALSPWDLGPLIVIVTEAGGLLTDFSGRATIYGGSVITTNGVLHEAVSSALRA